MRSRFLNPYFLSSSQSQFKAEESFDFLSISPPTLHSPPNQQLDLDYSCSYLRSDVKSEVDRLPFAAALSDFVSDVIPQFISDEIELEGVLEFNKDAKLDELLCDSPDVRVLEESDWMKSLEFDIPESASTNSCNGNEAAPIFNIPCIEIPLDTVDIEMKVTVTCPNDVVKSICKVELIPDCFSMKGRMTKPDELSEHGNKIPEFEVNEINSGLVGTLSLQNPFCNLLSCIDLGHHAHIHKMAVDAKELLGSTNLNVFEHFIANTSSEQCNIDEPVSVNSVIDTSMIDLNGSIVVEENSVIHPLISDESCSLRCSIYFQEVQILDVPTIQIFEQLGNSHTVKENEISDKIFDVEMNSVGSFYESIVSSELALVDDTFKSLPVPIFYDCKDVNFKGRIFGDILGISKPHALTASDNLYLDWHLLLEDACTLEICSTYTCMMYEVTYYKEDLTNNEDTSSVKLDFIDDSVESLDVIECKEDLTKLNDNSQQITDTSIKPEFSESNSGTVNQVEKNTENVIPDKVASLFDGMSQSDDLNFFMGARRGSVRKCFSGETTNRHNDNVLPCLKETPQPPALPEITSKQFDIEVHDVELSENILSLINNIQKSYLAILNYGTDLKSSTLSESEDLKFLSLSKEKLVELISEKSKNRCSSGLLDETFVGLLALYAIKQLTYILCFYGIHCTHLYISNLTRQIDSLAIRLRPLETLLEDARQKSERQLYESHPSLNVIEDILKSDTSQIRKFLIVAERLFWLSLNYKLTQMGIKLVEVIFDADKLAASGNNGFDTYIIQALLHADCVLISHENILDTFPFSKFTTVIEYGGSCMTSRISSVIAKLHLPLIHFIKVNMENHSLPKAICEGFDVPSFLTLDRLSRSMPSLKGILNREHIQEVLSVVPIDKPKCISSEFGNHFDSLLDNEPSAHLSNPSNSNSIIATEMSSLDVVIIINTQNLEKKMLISRRSSYQKVLALEKDGAQVVERDSSLPFDLIFSAAVCLVWYETRNFGENVTATSSIPMLMEAIATNVLMTLSFAFSGCIIIFEGETSFISAIMQSSDTLYAAAASLDLNLQLFCSYTPESTDEIILSCIRKASKSNHGIFPAMPESETLAESFLTKFPSINPLSAHAILSSGGILIEFLEWSQKRRILSVGKYDVPAESMHLFDSLCRYGEIGESKSVMTDCSSIGSDISSGKMLSEKKRQKHTMNSQDCYVHMNDPYHVETMNKTKDKITDFDKTSQPHNLSGSFDLQDKNKAKSSHLFTTNANLFSKCGPHASRVIDLDNDDIDNSESMNEKFGDVVIDYNTSFLHSEHEGAEKKRIPYSKTGSFDSSAVDNDFAHLNDNLSDVAVDPNSKYKNHSSIPRSTAFFKEPVPRTEPVYSKSDPHGSILTKKLSSYRTFPTSKELNSNVDSWTSVKDETDNYGNCKEKSGDEVIDHKITFLDEEHQIKEKRPRPYSRIDNYERNDYRHLNENSSDDAVGLKSTVVNENYSSIPRRRVFFEEEAPRTQPIYCSKSKLTSNPSSYGSFPTFEDLNCDINSWTSVKDRSPSLQEKILGRKASLSSKNASPSNRQGDHLKTNNVPITRSVLGLQNKIALPYSKAKQSSKMQNGMQSIFKYFQGSKDKTEVHRPSLTCNTCISCPGNSSNPEKSYKKISPSVIDNFRYRGNKQTPEIIKKWRKGGRAKDISTTKDRKETSCVMTPPWTPVDKRARQNLSFSRTGNEKQSKLVWTNRLSPESTYNSRKRRRDAV